MKEPESRSMIVQSSPSARQHSTVARTVLWMRAVLWDAFACEMVGSSRTETEFVRTVGKRMTESAMPVRMP